MTSLKFKSLPYSPSSILFYSIPFSSILWLPVQVHIILLANHHLPGFLSFFLYLVYLTNSHIPTRTSLHFIISPSSFRLNPMFFLPTSLSFFYSPTLPLYTFTSFFFLYSPSLALLISCLAWSQSSADAEAPGPRIHSIRHGLHTPPALQGSNLRCPLLTGVSNCPDINLKTDINANVDINVVIIANIDINIDMDIEMYTNTGINMRAGRQKHNHKHNHNINHNHNHNYEHTHENR